jgi:hypothetical protein
VDFIFIFGCLIIAMSDESKLEVHIVDTSAQFATAITYKERDELIKWVRGEAEKLGFTIVIVKSDYGADRRKQSFVLGCERVLVGLKNKGFSV